MSKINLNFEDVSRANVERLRRRSYMERSNKADHPDFAKNMRINLLLISVLSFVFVVSTGILLIFQWSNITGIFFEVCDAVDSAPVWLNSVIILSLCTVFCLSWLIVRDGIKRRNG